MAGKRVDPLYGLTASDIEPEFEPYGLDDSEEKSVTISFRVPARYARLANELRTDPDSPYYGMFRGQSDLPRHIYKKCMLLLAQRYKKTRGLATSLVLKEEAISRAAFREARRQNMIDATETVIKNLDSALQLGDFEDGGSILDGFLEMMLPMDIGMRNEYSKYLLEHPSFQRMRVNGELRKESKLLGEFEAEYASKTP